MGKTLRDYHDEEELCKKDGGRSYSLKHKEGIMPRELHGPFEMKVLGRTKTKSIHKLGLRILFALEGKLGRIHSKQRAEEIRNIPDRVLIERILRIQPRVLSDLKRVNHERCWEYWRNIWDVFWGRKPELAVFLGSCRRYGHCRSFWRREFEEQHETQFSKETGLTQRVYQIFDPQAGPLKTTLTQKELLSGCSNHIRRDERKRRIKRCG